MLFIEPSFMKSVNFKGILLQIRDDSGCKMTVYLLGNLEPTYRQLQTMKLDKSPFVIISVIGQELLAQAKYNAAVQVRISQEGITQNMLLFNSLQFLSCAHLIVHYFYLKAFLSKLMVHMYIATLLVK
jgi:hypothetical protein